MITIVNYGVGNPGALVNMFEFIGYDAEITDEASRILNASHLVLPGVGAFDAAMQRLRNSQLIPPLEQAVLERRIPLLGVCLGMQLLGRRSEEGFAEGLGWIAGEALKMKPNPARNIKIPSSGGQMFSAFPHRHCSTPVASSAFIFHTAIKCAATVNLTSPQPIELRNRSFRQFNTKMSTEYNFTPKRAIASE